MRKLRTSLGAGVLPVGVLAVAFAGFVEEAEQAPEKEKAPRFTLMDSDDEPDADGGTENHLAELRLGAAGLERGCGEAQSL